MRGMAIMAIMLHNYCHWLKDITRENEYIFRQENNDALLSAIVSADALLPVHLLSYFGHYGVPVFLFLSGYGLVMKYENGGLRPSTFTFIRYNYVKLLRILIPGFALFVVVDAMTPAPHRYHLLNATSTLLMFGNLLNDPSKTIWPGPYWYFGITMQLYLLYALLLARWRGWCTGVAAVLLCLLCQLSFSGDPKTMEWLRYNFVGSMLPFVMGLLTGRYMPAAAGRWSRRRWAAVCAASVVAVVACCLTFASWMLTPVFIITGCIGFVKMLPERHLSPLTWLGAVSASIFAVHPAIREVFVHAYWRQDIYAGLLLYVVATLTASWLFSQILNRIPKPRL